MGTPEKGTRSPLPKQSRARTCKEFPKPSLTAREISYDFTHVTTTNKPDPFYILKISELVRLKAENLMNL